MPTAMTHLPDIIPGPTLQQLQDSFAALIGQPVMIASPEGNPYTVPYGDCKPGTELLHRLCREAGESNASTAIQQAGGRCLYATPIQMRGIYMGCWVLCCKQALESSVLQRVEEHVFALSKLMEESFVLPLNALRQQKQKKQEEDASLLGKLLWQLEAAHAQRKKLSIAVVNLDGLAYANSAYGHDFGDLLLSNTASSIRMVIRAEDILGRLHGDTFVVVLPGCDKRLAETRLWQGKDKLGQLKIMGSTESFSFSYGLAENSEVPFNELDKKHSVRQLLDLAERRMRENKYHMMMGYAGF